MSRGFTTTATGDGHEAYVQKLTNRRCKLNIEASIAATEHIQRKQAIKERLQKKLQERIAKRAENK